MHVRIMADIVKESVLYKEVAATRFSLKSFPWRELKVRCLQSAFRQPSNAVSSGSNAGGFSYRDSGVVSSTCRNRSIVWQYDNGVLSLLELSMDLDLVSNALRLVFDSSATILLGAQIHELECSHIAITFSTMEAAYRLVLPHPEAIAKDPSLSAAGEGLVPSVLAFCSEDSFVGANTVSVFGMQDRPVSVTGFSSVLFSNGAAVFAFPSPTGSIFVVQLPPLGTHVLPSRTELKESSVINKLWNSFMPAVVKGSGDAEDAPVSIALHTFGAEPVVLALCKGLMLRVWSVQQGQCVLTHNLSDYLQADEESNSREDQLELRTAAFGTHTSLRFAVHMRVGLISQVSIFQLLLMDSQLLLQPINTYKCPQSCSLVDFHLTNSDVWGVWVCTSGEETEGEVIVKQAMYDCDLPTNWRGVPLECPPPDDVLISPQTDPREVYLDGLFHPGRFSTTALCKALELYGVSNLNEGALTRDDLINLVTQQVENELQQSASSDELRHDEYRQLSVKCWAKFYRCCLEYHQLLYKPMGFYQDPVTGLGLLVKKGVVSFVQPVSVTEYITKENGGDSIPGGHVGRFVQAVTETLSQLSQEVLDSFLLELGNHGNSPLTMAMEIAAALQEDGGDSMLVSLFSTLPDLPSVLDSLLETMDPTTADLSNFEDMDDGMGEDSEFQTATSQLYASSVAMVMLGSTLQGVCLSRLSLCRDVLVVLCALRLTGRMEVSPVLHKKYIPSFTNLLHCYQTLHWLTTRPTLTHTSGAFEANLKLLASLEITPRKNSRNSSTHSSTLAELFVSTRGHSEIATELMKGRGMSETTPLLSHWGELAPTIISSLLRSLWPMSSACDVCEFLLSNCQYYYVQEFISQVRTYTQSSWYSSTFLLGQSYLGNGELEKAFNCFTEAAAGVGQQSEVVLHRVGGESGDGGVCGEGVGQYYIKVLRLFEQIPSPSYVIKIADVATSVVSKDNPETAILWSTLFKYHLEFGHSREAYHAMMGNPDPVRRKECLHRLVVVLTEQKKLKELCDFTYSGLEEEIEKVIELRARSVDVTNHSYYDLLYCFHTSRGNHRKAAYVMYEHGLRLCREAPGPKSLHKQANCYCMALTSLRLIDPKYAWVVRPVEIDEVTISGKKTSKRKRTLKGSDKTKVEVLTLSDIEKEYLLVRAKLSLIKQDPSLTTQLASPFVSTDEITSLLVQVGLFDKAITIVKRFSLPMVSIFESLASRCVHLSVNVMSFRPSSANTTSWDWLGLNESACVTTVRENTIADKAWSMLRSNLESHDQSADHVLQKCVARKLLSMGSQLPQWLVDKYKKTNPAELLKLYLTFDLLEPATRLALEYIDSIMGHGKEFCGLETALHAQHPSVWLPYAALDHLQLALKKSPPDTILEELSEELTSKLDRYFQLTASTSSTMEQETLRSMHSQLPSY